MNVSGDDAVRSTNNDATSSKAWAVKLGYWSDPYVHFFSRATERKAPEMNRGYYARVKGVQTLLDQFLEITQRQCQIVNLGAGSDTLFFNLKAAEKTPLKVVDIDFKDVTTHKCLTVRRAKPLLEILGEEQIRFDDGEMYSAPYDIVHCDLRKTDEFSSKISKCGLDTAVPTVFVAECVLIYMQSGASQDLLKWIADNFKTALFLNYEQVNMSDRFGEVMVENLKVRGCQLAGVEHCKSLASQKDRFLGLGWSNANAVTMSDVYKFLPKPDVQRIERLEFLDEVEMLNQLLDHYCISWASIDNEQKGLSGIHFQT